jgi:phosphate transport system permease protein
MGLRDRLLAAVLAGSAALTAALLGLVVAVVAVGAAPALAAGPGAFIAGVAWDPASGTFGAWALVAGSLAVTGLALVIGVPLGAGVGIASGWLLPPRPAAVLRVAMLVAAGIPSVVLGLWGLTALVPLLARWQPPGVGLLAAGLVLALMLVPTVAAAVDAALRSVAPELRRGAAALALGRWAALRAAAGPTLAAALVAGGVLALARALGETMAVLLVAGNVVQVPDSLLAPVRTLTGAIALEMAYAEGLHRSALFALAGIALAVVTALLVLLRPWLRRVDAVAV